jgi:NhaD family Na+/H+ antiporter
MTISSGLMIFVFILGYFLITIESLTKINKATIALLMAIICWIIQFTSPLSSHAENTGFLGEHLANISQVIFFLLGALTIVELINAHHGFDVVSELIHCTSKKKLLWIIGVLTFFLSAILDNLTTTIVMVSLLHKMIDDGEDKLLIGGAVVIAANAGGAWTPIGDVTTTMLWIGGQVSTINIMKSLFLPSLGCLIAALGVLSFKLKGDFERKDVHIEEKKKMPQGRTVFYLGIALLVFVPIFKLLTGLPPFMGMLFSLSLLWLITDLLHYNEDREHLRVPYAMTRIDLSGVLFFLGILLCINALETAHLLSKLANFLSSTGSSITVLATMIGLASAVVDNVPLVAATMGMYDLVSFPQDHDLWKLIAFCAGTGGSILLIGSAAGVVFMGMAKVDFMWYFRKISFAALVGYFVGIAIYILG